MTNTLDNTIQCCVHCRAGWPSGRYIDCPLCGSSDPIKTIEWEETEVLISFKIRSSQGYAIHCSARRHVIDPQN